MGSLDINIDFKTHGKLQVSNGEKIFLHHIFNFYNNKKFYINRVTIQLAYLEDYVWWHEEELAWFEINKRENS